MKVSRINLAVKLFDRISVQKYFHHIEIRQFQTYISFLCQISARVCLHQPIQVVFFFIFIFEKKLPYFCRLDSSLYLIKDTKIFFDTLTFMMISNKFWILQVETLLQVNLCQKLLFLHQLTHNMTTDSSWITSSIHENSKLKPGENMLCTEIVSDIQNNFCTQHVLPMFSPCSSKRRGSDKDLPVRKRSLNISSCVC